MNTSPMLRKIPYILSNIRTVSYCLASKIAPVTRILINDSGNITFQPNAIN